MDNIEDGSFILEFMGCVGEKITYAIERNIESAEKSLVGDIDLLISGDDFGGVLAAAKDMGLLLSVARAYGGARVFIGRDPTRIKRIDCIWRLHYRGIPLLDVGQLLAARVRDPDSGLYVLPEHLQALATWAIKSAYGGADRYSELFHRHGFTLQGPGERRAWLVHRALASPTAMLFGLTASLAFYLLRFIAPSGLLVSGVTARELRESRALCYLFQGRIRDSGSIVMAMLRSRIFSELCVTGHGHLAQIRFSESAGVTDCEQAIFDYLKAKSGVLG